MNKLEAITARISGEWDNPELLKLGELHDTLEDIKRIMAYPDPVPVPPLSVKERLKEILDKIKACRTRMWDNESDTQSDCVVLEDTDNTWYEDEPGEPVIKHDDNIEYNRWYEDLLVLHAMLTDGVQVIWAPMECNVPLLTSKGAPESQADIPAQKQVTCDHCGDTGNGTVPGTTCPFCNQPKIPFGITQARNIIEEAIRGAYVEAHQMAGTITGDESPEQLLDREKLEEQLAECMLQQVNDNLPGDEEDESNDEIVCIKCDNSRHRFSITDTAEGPICEHCLHIDDDREDDNEVTITPEHKITGMVDEFTTEYKAYQHSYIMCNDWDGTSIICAIQKKPTPETMLAAIELAIREELDSAQIKTMAIAEIEHDGILIDVAYSHEQEGDRIVRYNLSIKAVY